MSLWRGVRCVRRGRHTVKHCCIKWVFYYAPSLFFYFIFLLLRFRLKYCSLMLYQHIFVNKVPIGYIGPKIRGIKRSNGRFNITKISNTNYQIWKYKVKLLLIWEDLWYTINMVDLNNRMRNNLKRTGTCYDRPISWIWSIKIH